MYKNSLIVRLAISEKPFVHDHAFSNVKSSFIYHDEAAKIVMKLLKFKGVINIGGKTQTIYNFAKKTNKKVKKISYYKKNKISIPKNSSMSIKKLNKVLKMIKFWSYKKEYKKFRGEILKNIDITLSRGVTFLETK